ncbi:hypothetical protein B296_00003289 [Ensete ventricosum]|uniref:Uncharacterized protein n=1 Tax=Ensete ventricosum TaxID=4639 RepID=A0A427BB06_ENSVE|nr:hypothetical protein B296_00003289 [Ensete ventricosum]
MIQQLTATDADEQRTPHVLAKPAAKAPDRIRPSVNKAATPKRKEMADWERKAERGKRVTLCMKGEKICKSKKTRRSKIGRTDGGREGRKVLTSGTESRCSDSEERRAVF